MCHRRVFRAAFVSVLMFLCWGVSAARAEDGPALAVSAGIFNVTKSVKDSEGGLELRLRPRGWNLVPTWGVSGTEEGSVWLYGGVRRDLALAKGWFVTPGFAISVYEKGDGKDLGGVVEFRSSLELAYESGRGNRVGVTFYHLSNSGFYDRNPGSNSLILSVSFPLAGG